VLPSIIATAFNGYKSVFSSKRDPKSINTEFYKQSDINLGWEPTS
jgi:hypothetical protein